LTLHSTGDPKIEITNDVISRRSAMLVQERLKQIGSIAKVKWYSD
jgi:hypothetical protein